MIIKEQFCKYLNEMQELRDTQDKINNAIREMKYTDTDFISGYGIVIGYEESMIELIAMCFGEGDTSLIEDDISWWIYDTDFGRCEKEYKTMAFPDGKELVIDTAEDLYKYLATPS